GVLNVGSGVSGIYNTSVLPLGTPAVLSGLGNVGHQLSGVSAAGTALNQIPILNIGLADVGNFNVGFRNFSSAAPDVDKSRAQRPARVSTRQARPGLANHLDHNRVDATPG
ncbi:hypothetical protein, partial [Mycobacterium tuberculosis]|uniref:hypothetical protein n=1 Tax=Mycobacterium tuberculosis TaxID=1773 RepID=UPI00214D1B47